VVATGGLDWRLVMTLPRPLTAVLFLAASVLALPRTSEAGPPLICHPFATASEAVLPWGSGPGWNTPDQRYDVQRLTGDVLRLLTPRAPILARMENIRRATIYAGQDPRVANELLAAVLARAVAASAGSAPDPLALFDAGYLLESYKQAAHLHRYNMLAPAAADRWTLRSEPAGDGYAMVVRAIGLTHGNPDMEFAASLMKEGTASTEHRRRAEASAKAGSLLARNLSR
jgi:hypothetical protein